VLTRADHPTAEEVLGVVRDAFAVVLEVDPVGITRDSTLAALDVDSLALVEVAEILEEQFTPYAQQPFVIADADLEQFSTVGQTVDYVMARL
jgi:acyl carrier protein